MNAPTLQQAHARIAILTHVIELLKEARMANPEHFPGLGRKIRSALKSAHGSLNNAYRFSGHTHAKVPYGQCAVCRHYGDDCTGVAL